MDLATRVSQIIETAKENLSRGHILEPRFFYDEITVNSGASATSVTNFSDPGVFKNGEDDPIHITKMMAALSLLDANDAVVSDERLIQRIGARLSFHGHDYMDRDFVRFPLWHTKTAASSYVASFGLSSHKFDVPWILSARDTMKVTAQLDVAPDADTTRTVQVAFTGYGLQTMRPYFKAGEVDLSTTVATVITPDSFRSDGDEPICITDMTVYCSAQSDDNNPQGDVRRCRVSVQQVGNGTQADWVAGPSSALGLMPGTLWGTHCGRAVIHEFPSPLIWEPGEGLQVELQSMINSLNANNVIVALGFYGTLVKT